MSTTTELLRKTQEIEELRAELALVNEQHAAACAKYEKLRRNVESLIARWDSERAFHRKGVVGSVLRSCLSDVSLLVPRSAWSVE